MKKIQVLTSILRQKNFPEKVFEILYKIEKKHFWFAGRNQVIKIIINRFIKHKQGIRFLEIGCGNGIVLCILEKLGFLVTGLDIHKKGLEFARKRTKADLICADVYKLKIKEKYEVIGLFDVLEHINNDKSFLRKCREILNPGGAIVLTVPADMRLWSRMDEVSGHKRRYTKKSIIALLHQMGYHVEFASYFNCLLYIPQLLFRRFSDRKMKEKNDNFILVDELRLPTISINLLFKFLFILESQLLRIIPLPFGASLVVVGYKKG